VDCVRLTCRRGPRDLVGAGFAETVDGDALVEGAGAVASGREGCSCSTLCVNTLSMLLLHRSRYMYRPGVRYLLLPWRGYGWSRIVKGRLQVEVSLRTVRLRGWLLDAQWLTVPG
jgi:hypothetical protein